MHLLHISASKSLMQEPGVTIEAANIEQQGKTGKLQL